MLDAGLGDMAVADLDYRVNRMKDHNSKTIVTMAYLYSGMLQNHRAINLLTSLGFAINPKEPKISREIAQLLYPRPYWESIVRYSNEYGVDPYLVVALMREESLFNSQARSKTGALGLMQIMPSTGQGIAKGLRMEWEGPEMLLVPQTNIRFGIYYLSSLKKRFNNNPILMLSGYNAGPNATRKWLDKSPSDVDMDIFVANIPYSETHYYVTRVLKSYWIYRLLYDPEFKDKAPPPGK
jgi:soluble lytic murein transglycosylase